MGLTLHMMKIRSSHSSLRLLLAMGICATLAWPVAAQAPSLAMLDRLEPGLWELRDRGTAGKTRICIRSGRDLIQLRHPSKACNRIVIEDGDSEVTVQYMCKGDGYGRTNIRLETAGLVQIEGQGIADSHPFEFSIEARMTGACAK